MVAFVCAAFPMNNGEPQIVLNCILRFQLFIYFQIFDRLYSIEIEFFKITILLN